MQALNVLRAERSVTKAAMAATVSLEVRYSIYLNLCNLVRQ